jgi:toxin-antitoxin system PIN domain toxin
MILIDANLLLYAYDAASEQHQAASAWLAASLSKAEPVGLAWVTILAFLRIATNPRMRAQPFTSSEAVAVVNEWLDRPNVAVLAPTERHWSILQDLIPRAQVRGPLMIDAHLAVLAIEHGAVLCTNDRDFSRFPGLKWMNPLEAG